MSTSRTTLIGPYAVAGLPGQVHTEQLNPLGMEAHDHLGNRYVYAQGVASTVAGAWVTVGVSFVTALLTLSMTGRVAIATAAVLANQFGWYQIEGFNTVALAGSTGVIVSGGGYLQAVDSDAAGRVVLGVSAAAASFIFGAFSYSAQPVSESTGADMITVYLNRPFATKNY